MTMERLRTILSAYGAEPTRWPAAERMAAEALLARSAEARSALGEARALDTTLDRMALSPPSLDAVALAAAASATPQPRRQAVRSRPSLFGVRLGWTSFAGLAVAGVAGLVIGLSGLAPLHSPSSGIEVAGVFAAQEIEPW